MSIDAAFTTFPAFTTNRLHLRPLWADDAEALFAIRSDREVTEAYGQEPYQSLDEAHRMIQRLQAIYERREGLFWGITLKEADTVIGSCTLFQFDAGFHCAEIGYEFHRARWGQGFATEAVSTVLNYGFTELNLHRIEALVLGMNTASQKVLLKLGFTHEGKLRQRAFLHDHYEDDHYFGLLKDEWLKTG